MLTVSWVHGSLFEGTRAVVSKFFFTFPPYPYKTIHGQFLPCKNYKKDNCSLSQDKIKTLQKNNFAIALYLRVKLKLCKRTILQKSNSKKLQTSN